MVSFTKPRKFLFASRTFQRRFAIPCYHSTTVFVLVVINFPVVAHSEHRSSQRFLKNNLPIISLSDLIQLSRFENRDRSLVRGS
mmetsp:Transcript_7271/g.15149  ORF Transcript_7271/g.15149 Transcript_7271/m.15149 type:complete len:84 (-) Transcript_7271:430-681(-)